MDTDANNIERGFIARTIYRRSGKTLQQSFVEAKKNGVDSDWFSDHQCKILWMSCESLFNEKGFNEISVYKILQRANKIAGESKDKALRDVTVDTQFLKKSEEMLTGTEGLHELSKMLRDKVIARKCGIAFQESADSFHTGDDAATTVSKLVSRCQEIIREGSERSSVSVKSLTEEVKRQYENAYHNVQELGNSDYTPGLPLPWKKLSFVLNGFPSVLTVVAARPGVGKTSLAVSMMRYWMDNGIKVVFNSLDMAGVEFMKRQLSEISQVSSRKLQFGKSSKDEWEKYDLPALEAACEKMVKWEEDGIFTLFTEPDIDVLKANVKILKDQGRIDVLVVDYIQLMGYKGSERVSKQQCVTRVSNLLHSITTEIGIPVLALSQINRDSSKEGLAPQLHDIKDSGAIEQDATNVIILHPNKTLKNKWNADSPPTQFLRNGSSSNAKALMPMLLIVAKARDGDAGTKLPFLVVQNKYSWYICDYDAADDAMWEKVWDNWKHDSIEKVWEANGSLLKEENQRQLDQFNNNMALVQSQNASSIDEEVPF